MGTTAANQRASRALAVLAVLLGLLAMHGLASTHHVLASTHHVAAAATHGAVPAAAGLGGQASPHQHAPLVPAAVDGAVALAAPEGPSCDAGCADLAVLCVAVLAGAALLALLLARRRRVALLPAPTRYDAATGAAPPRDARGPDPVTELCVSRT